MVAPSCALMSSPMIGRFFSRKRRSHSGLRGDEHRHAVDHRDAGLQRAFHVEFDRLLRADGQEVDQDLGAALLQHGDDLVLAGLGRVGLLEAALAIIGHMRRDAVQHPAHAHGHAGMRDLALEHGRAIGLGEDRLAQILADLARIDVDRQHELDVGQLIAAEPLVHDPRRRLAARIIITSLHQGARAIADADQRHLDLVHISPVLWPGLRPGNVVIRSSQTRREVKNLCCTAIGCAGQAAARRSARRGTR